MAVDDLWLSKKIDPEAKKVDPETKKRKRTARYGRGKRWRVRWTDPDTGEPRSEAFDRKEDAEIADAARRTDIARGLYIDPTAGRVTLGEYAESWRRSQLHDVATARLVEQALRLHVVPILGELPIGGVRPSHLRNWVKDRANGHLAPSTLRLVYGYITTMMTAAVADRMIGRTPCVGVQLPDIDRPDRWLPSPEQVHALYDAMYERYRAAIYVAAGCGLRPSEVLGLERADVDFLRREVKVHQQIKQVTGATFIAPPKTRTSKRVVELPNVVAMALAEHFEKYPSTPVLLRDETSKDKGVRPADLVFTTRAGKAINRSGWSKPWGNARKKVEGMPADFGMHGLRHYFATLLIHAGASVKTVQMALGHSSPMITLNTYTHEWPDAIDRTRSLVDGILGAPAADVSTRSG